MINDFYRFLRIVAFVIGGLFWTTILLLPLTIRYLCNSKEKRVFKHPNIALIFIVKVIDDLFKPYIKK